MRWSTTSSAAGASAIPYCTLCGSAQAYFTDRVPASFERIELRTSGLLSRSNKVMFDLHTLSIFDTFRGVAVSGPIQDEGVVLEMVSVVTSTWGDWKAAHPDTTIIAPDGGIGRVYALDPLRGRDDDGPIFPVGAVDPRRPVQELVLGIELPDGTTLAFPVEQARRALEGGVDGQLDGVRLTADAGGVRAGSNSSRRRWQNRPWAPPSGGANYSLVAIRRPSRRASAASSLLFPIWEKFLGAGDRGRTGDPLLGNPSVMIRTPASSRRTPL